MARRKVSDDGNKVREFVLVPSFKLAALEKTHGEIVPEDPSEDKSKIRVNSEGETKKREDRRPEVSNIDYFGRAAEDDDHDDEPGGGESNANNVKARTHGAEKDKHHLQQQQQPVQQQEKQQQGQQNKRRGNSLDERRKRLRKLWLNL